MLKFFEIKVTVHVLRLGGCALRLVNKVVQKKQRSISSVWINWKHLLITVQLLTRWWMQLKLVVPLTESITDNDGAGEFDLVWLLNLFLVCNAGGLSTSAKVTQKLLQKRVQYIRQLWGIAQHAIQTIQIVHWLAWTRYFIPVVWEAKANNMVEANDNVLNLATWVWMVTILTTTMTSSEWRFRPHAKFLF